LSKQQDNKAKTKVIKQNVMTTKGKLEAFFNTEKEELKLIEKYEENITFFNDLLKNGHKEDIEYVIPIKILKYADPLIQKGYYTKAFRILDESERELEKIKGQSKWYGMYSEHIIFLKGVCFGRLKKYRESNKYFKQLVNKKPINDRYVDWYKSNKQCQIAEISNFIVIIVMSFYIVSVILSIANISIIKIPRIVGTFALIIGLLTWVVSYIWRKIIEKQRIKINQGKRATA